MFTISLLGTPSIIARDRPVTTLRRKNRALVYYLAAQAGPVTRDRLLTFFWPDDERSSAQHTFRTMLHDLRKSTGDLIETENDLLNLHPSVSVDARLFEAGISAARRDAATLTAALLRYRGAFLDGFTLADTPGFDSWVDAERERYQLLAARGLVALGDLNEAEGNYESALDALLHAVAFDPLQEEIQRATIRLHYLSGDRTGAIRRYESLVRLLDDELGVPPMPETRTLYDAIINDRLPRPERRARPVTVDPLPSAPKPSVEQRPFVGRIAQLRALAESMTSGRLLLIEGEPGIGKTRLVDEAVRERLARPDGGNVSVLRGAAHESEQALPYQPMIDALRGLIGQDRPPTLELPPIWLAEVARLLPELTSIYPDLPAPSPSPGEAQLWDALTRFLLANAQHTPILLCLDDLHWADTATLGLLGYLVRRSASSPLTLLATSRPPALMTRLSVLLQTLAHENRLLRLSLSGLPEPDIRALVVQLSGSADERLAEWLIRRSDGNPYFVVELVRFATETDLIRADGSLDAARLASMRLPEMVENLIHSRLAGLSAAARRALEVGAVIGDPFDFDTVGSVTGMLESASLDAADELQSAGLLRPMGGQYSFDHSLTRDVVERTISEARRAALHRQVAEALEARQRGSLDGVSGALAYHFSHSNVPERSVPYALQAGRRAAGFAAWEQAIALYEGALALDAPAPLRADLLASLARARFHRGEFAAGTDRYRAALDLARQMGDLDRMEDIYLMLNQTLLPQGRYAEAIALGQELRQHGPEALAACAEFIWGTGLSVESAHPREAERHLREARRLLGQLTRPTRMTAAQISYQLAGVIGQLGDEHGAVALYWEALNAVRADPDALDLLRQIMLFNNLAYHLYLLDDPSAAEYVKAGIALAREKGSLSHLPYLLSTSGEIALAQGDFDGAEGFFSEGLTLAQQIPIPERVAGNTANLGRVAAARGDALAARGYYEQAIAQADLLDVRHLAVRARLWLAELLPLDEARQTLRVARAIAAHSGFDQLLAEIDTLDHQFPSV